MFSFLPLLFMLLPSIFCVSRIQSNGNDNLLIDAGQGKNITMFANAMLLNGEEIATEKEIMAMFVEFYTAFAQINSTLRSEIAHLRVENQRLKDQLAQLNSSTLYQQTALNSFATQTTNQISNVNTKLHVLQPQIQQNCVDNPSLLISIFQQIETNGAHNWKYFTINGTSFLVVANSLNGSSSTMNSYIYAFDPLSSQFVLYQQIETFGASDWEYFKINNTDYLAVANFRNSTSRNVKSNIYRFDTTISQFVLFQQFVGTGALGWKFFTIHNNSYLALANSFNGTIFNLKSNIYRFNETISQFVLYQQLDTHGAIDWDFFDVNNASFLAVASFNDDISRTVNTKSFIYRFNETTSQFVLFQQIDTNGARGWEYFSINSNSYLVVANLYNNVTRNIKSKIYRFNFTTSQFDLFQQIDTHGARDWEYFTINNNSYLAVANYHNDTSYNLKSAIYRFDSTTSQFVPFLEIDTNGALNWEYFSIDDVHYLAVANSNDGTSNKVQSNIYQLTNIAACWDMVNS